MIRKDAMEQDAMCSSYVVACLDMASGEQYEINFEMCFFLWLLYLWFIYRSPKEMCPLGL